MPPISRVPVLSNSRPAPIFASRFETAVSRASPAPAPMPAVNMALVAVMLIAPTFASLIAPAVEVTVTSPLVATCPSSTLFTASRSMLLAPAAILPASAKTMVSPALMSTAPVVVTAPFTLTSSALMVVLPLPRVSAAARLTVSSLPSPLIIILAAKAGSSELMLTISSPLPALIVSVPVGLLNVVSSPAVELTVVCPPPASVTVMVSLTPL
ncbi:hypothetical protein MalM14_18030 [Gimesia chilikensis]|nr:hypothetical protein MalM14_18030 [Gimesia chilikensis]